MGEVRHPASRASYRLVRHQTGHDFSFPNLLSPSNLALLFNSTRVSLLKNARASSRLSKRSSFAGGFDERHFSLDETPTRRLVLARFFAFVPDYADCSSGHGFPRVSLAAPPPRDPARGTSLFGLISYQWDQTAGSSADTDHVVFFFALRAGSPVSPTRRLLYFFNGLGWCLPRFPHFPAFSC